MSVLGRWLKFNAVGLGGVAVQLAALALYRTGFGLNTLLATFLAVETAVVHNFFWHERWTWVERTRKSLGVRRIISRLVRFNLANGAVSIVGNLVIMWLLVDRLQMHYIVSNLLAIGACSIVNFFVSDRLVFRIS
jgi:dolichol-phosphate mannosyltransferase